MKDPRTRSFLLPTRLVLQEGVIHPENLLIDDESRSVLPPGASLILDFGKERHGGVRFDVPTTEPKGSPLVRVVFGESVSETLGVPDQDHAIHTHEIRLAWMGRTEVGETGFRFVRIENIDPVHEVHLRVVYGVSVLRDEPWLGSFECSDPRLTAIWETGAYTVHLCMQDHVWDGIKRDRLVWIGDLHPEAMVIASVFGNHPIVRESLDYVRDRTPLPQWMNGISSYSLWWLLIHADWYARFGDREYLEEQRPYIMGLLELVLARVGPDGSEQLDGHRFLEWPTARDPEAIAAGLQALVTLTLKRGAWLCRLLREAPLADRCYAAAALAASVSRPSTSKQANALQVLAAMREPVEANRQLLAVDPNRGLSTFYGYYVLEARAKAGDILGCLDLIRTYWGGMLDAGATTFWEGFELDLLDNAFPIDSLPVAGKKDIHADFGDHCYVGLRHSLCHGWAAGPTAWLQEWVLGIRTEGPGMKTIRCQPHLGDLEWAKGAVPTPHGLIVVEHTRRPDGSVATHLQLPPGVTRGA